MFKNGPCFQCNLKWILTEHDFNDFKLAIKSIRYSENYFTLRYWRLHIMFKIKTGHVCSLKQIFMRISLKYFKTKIVFKKIPVENTGQF